MTNLKELFAKKEGQEVSADISPEEYRHIHVMQDDMDELSGKAPEKRTFLSTAGSAAATAGNPFLGEPDSQSGSVEVTVKKAIKEENAASPITIPKIKRRTWFIVGAAAVFVLMAVAAYLLYVKMGTKEEPEAAGPVSESTEVVTEPSEIPSTTVASERPFSVSGANFLQLDTASTSTTPDGIIASLAETASRMSDMDVAEPVEFMVRDLNNNPIAFSRFSYLIGLKLPADLLASLDESFSLYFVRDSTAVRRSLIVQVKDTRKFEAAIVKHEATLPEAFSTLLYGKSDAAKSALSFRDGSFGAIRTRFALVDSAAGLSFDHVMTGKRWIIGTSKDSFQSILGIVITKTSN